jgi:hypothetical protein
LDYDVLVAATKPGALREALAARADELRQAGVSHEHGATSVRTASHKGHEIVVRTTYEITIDGEPFDASLVVDNAGRVFYHGLPTQDFASTIDLVKKAIDTFPDFADPDDHDHHGHHEHHDPEG